MTNYFKAVNSDGESFYDSRFKWNLEPGGVTTHNHPRHSRLRSSPPDAAHYLSVSKIATDCTGFRWPCRLLVVEPTGETFFPDSLGMPNKIAGFTFRTVEELPAWQVFGSNGQAIVAVIERTRTLTGDEASRLSDAWGATGTHVWFAATNNAILAASWSAAWNAANAAVRTAIRANANGSEYVWAVIAWSSDAAAWAALAELAKDSITVKDYETLMTPWWSAIRKSDVEVTG